MLGFPPRLAFINGDVIWTLSCPWAVVVCDQNARLAITAKITGKVNAAISTALFIRVIFTLLV
jgi:hypothetical protein